MLEVDAPQVLRCRWTGVFGETVVTFRLTPTTRGTRLRLEHTGWADDAREQRDGFDGGWRDKLTDDLPRALSTRTEMTP